MPPEYQYAKAASPEHGGYGPKHRAERKRVDLVVQQGVAYCMRCDELIEPGTAWDLGHNDDRTLWTGPEHASCNRADGAHKTNAKRRGERVTSRDW